MLTDRDVTRMASEWSNFLTANSHFTRLGNDSVRVTTPFADNFGDGIVINVQPVPEGFLVSDQGYTIWNLSSNGVDVLKKGSNRHRLLLSTIAPYGFELSSDNAIQAIVRSEELPQAITDLSQVLINVSDLAFLSRTNTASIFYEDVQAYFNNNREKYSFVGPMYAQGKSFMKYRFDYVFSPRPNDFKLAKLYTNLNKNTMDVIIGIWSDTQKFPDENMGGHAAISVLVNGLSKNETDYAKGLQQHGIQVYDFTNKKDLQANLAIQTA